VRHEARPRAGKDATQFALENILRSPPRVDAGPARPGLQDAIPLGLFEPTRRLVSNDKDY